VNGTGGTPAVTEEAAASGTHSLRVDGLGASGALQNSTALRPHHLGWHKITAMVRLTSPAAPTWVQLDSPGDTGVTGMAQVTSDRWTTVTAYVSVTRTTTTTYCNGATSTGPSTIALRLRLIQVPCGVPIDPATSLYLDDVVTTTADSATDGTPSPIPTPVGPVPPAGCSPSSSISTTPTPSAGCGPGYVVQSTWPGGYLAAVSLRNLGSRTISSWTLTWTYPDDQQVVSLWGAANWTQTGRTVSVTGPSWAPVAAGGSASVGFVGQSVAAGGPALPSRILVEADGQPCGALG
jgi:hypothetical protein